MKVLGIIPARYASSRFPGKPLIDLKGKSMIQRVYEGAVKCTSLTTVIVATDDQRIYEHVLAFGGKAIMTKANHTSGTDRCGEVIEQHKGFDVVLNIQGDEPLVSAQQLEELISAFKEDKVEIATLGITKVSKEDLLNPNRIKVVLDANSDAMYFSRSPIPSTQHASSSFAHTFRFVRHIGLYAYRATTLNQLVKLEKTDLEQTESLEQLRWMYYGYKIKIAITAIETPNIDVPEDVEAVLAFL